MQAWRRRRPGSSTSKHSFDPLARCYYPKITGNPELVNDSRVASPAGFRGRPKRGVSPRVIREAQGRVNQGPCALIARRYLMTRHRAAPASPDLQSQARSQSPAWLL